MNVLILTNKLNFTDGVTSHLYQLLKKTDFPDMKIYIITSGGDAVKKFDKLNIEISVFPKLDFYSRSILNYLSSVKHLLKFVKEKRIDVINSHNHYCANLAKSVSLFVKTKSVQTLHGIIDEKGILKHYASDFYICVNKHIEKFIIDNKISNHENNALIFNGIDFETQNNLAVKENEKIHIFAASRLVKEKGIDVLINAVNQLNDNLKRKITLTIAGEGEFESELKSISENSEVEINFCGNLENPEPEFLKTDIFVIPTNSSSEGFPMTILEAAKAKNFIISSDFPGCRYILQDNTDAFIFTCNDIAELKSKIEYALNHTEECKKISVNFYEKARTLYNNEIMAAKYYEFLKRILQPQTT